MRWFRPRRRAPQNVRVVLADGTENPVGVVYAGWKDEAHHWDVVVPAGLAPVSMRVGMLPGRTSIGVSLAPAMTVEER